MESGYLTSRALGEEVGVIKGRFNAHLCVLPLVFIRRKIMIKATAVRTGINIYNEKHSNKEDVVNKKDRTRKRYKEKAKMKNNDHSKNSNKSRSFISK